MSLSIWNPSGFNVGISQLRNAAKLLFASKLGETAFQVSKTKNKTVVMPRYGYGGNKTIATRKRKTRSKKTKVATVAAVKKMIMSQQEKKFISGTATLASITNDTLFTFNLTARITTGTEDGNRIGDSVNLTNLEGFVKWYTDTEAAYYQLRVIVFWCGEEYDLSGTLFSSSGFGGTQLFKPYSSFPCQAIPNPKAITVLHDAFMEINSQLDGFEDGRTHRFNIPLNGQKFNYRQDLSKYGKTKNLYCVIIGNYSSSNANPPENIGAAFLNYSLNYTDS